MAGLAQLERVTDEQYQKAKEATAGARRALDEVADTLAYDGSLVSLRSDVTTLMRSVAQLWDVVKEGDGVTRERRPKKR
jgi:AAA+ superfamily predicted ATPase